MEIKDLRLGMPYYVVNPVGKISISKVNSLEFADKDNFSTPVINGGILDKFSLERFVSARSFDNAYTLAVEMLRKALCDKTRTIEEDEKWRKRKAFLESHKEGLRMKLEPEFAAITPLEHFPLGTMLWYAQVDSWRITKGKLLEVRQYREKESYPSEYPETLKYGNPQYRNGFYPGVTYTEGFFDSEEEALGYLANQFAKKLPGKLVHSKVPIINAEVYSKAREASAAD